MRWDYSAECKDEVMDLLFVKKVCRYRVAHRIFRQVLRLLLRKFDHFLGIELDWVVAKFCFGDSFEPMRPLREIGIALDPIKAVHMRRKSASEFARRGIGNADFALHAQLINVCACLDVGPVEVVTIEGGKYGRLCFTHMLKPLLKEAQLVGLVKNGEFAHVVVIAGSVLEIGYVFTNNGPISNQETLPINYV